MCIWQDVCVSLCEMWLAMVVNISAGHKHAVGPFYNWNISVHLCVRLEDHRFATNPQTHKEGRCLCGYDDLQVGKKKKETKTSKTGCKMERKNARRSQGMHSHVGDCTSATRASGFSSQKEFMGV